MGTLYLVATPIGNLDDMSPRAIKTLQEVGLIAAEDTRRTRKLLTHFGIKTSLYSYHEHNRFAALPPLLDRLEAGDLALVSDAGTPGLSDPGLELVRAALERGHRVSPVPGPSAPLAALVASGLPAGSFLFLGYLPRKAKARRALLLENIDQPHSLVLLEAPHRLLDALRDLADVLGDRQVVVARELTKVHEEFLRGTAEELHAHFAAEAPRGEITLVVEGASPAEDVWTEALLSERIRLGLREGEAPSALARRLAAESGWPRREIYDRIREESDVL